MQFNKVISKTTPLSYSKIVAIILFYFLCINKSLSQIEKQFPVPAGNPNQLFYLQRSKNINTVIYELNIINGKLNSEKPIDVFWIMYTKDKKRENLSEMEKDFVYGVKINPPEKKEYSFTLAAYPKLIFS